MSTRRVNVHNIATSAIRNVNYERLRGALEQFKEARIKFVDAEAELMITDINSLENLYNAIDIFIYSTRELVKKSVINKNLYNDYNDKLMGLLVDLKQYSRVLQRIIQQLQQGRIPTESNTYRDLKARLIALKGINNSKNISLRNLERRLAKLKLYGGKRSTKKRSNRKMRKTHRHVQ